VRLRLTLWFVFGIVLVTALGAAGVYAILSNQLRSDLDERLAQQLTHFQQVVGASADEQALIDSAKAYLSGPQSNALRRNGYVFSMQTADGTIISNSSEVRLEELAESRALLESGEPFLVDADTAEETLRVAGTPVMLDGEQIGAVQIAGTLTAVSDTLGSLLVLLAVGGAIGCVIVGLGSWVLLGRALEPVRRITRTAAAISQEDLSRRIGYSGARDEIGELALTMDAMLDRLQSAFAAQERFIADASHELRTPLTIMKGHLQVLDRQESPDPKFVRQEHALVLDELDRMNRLVADLLTLARATRVDFLRHDVVDVDGFLSSLAAQGTHLGDRDWQVDALPGGTVRADQDRLTQVFLNLMQNAVRHTEPGRRIALGAEWVAAGSGRGLALWVRDEGVGMDEQTAKHVFDRFYRGGMPGDGDDGLGLGLAIVRAVVEAHGGMVTVRSALGEGAQFTIFLPSAAPAEGLQTPTSA
jgi:two-component system OmpR family sensor kinase